MSEHDKVKAANGTEFEALMQKNEIMLVDFWASWCAPCRQFEPIYKKVAEKYPQVLFTKINIEEEQEVAETFHIRSIPHLMVIKQSIVIYSESGSMPESTLTELVEQALAADVSAIRESINQKG